MVQCAVHKNIDNGTIVKNKPPRNEWIPNLSIRQSMSVIDARDQTAAEMKVTSLMFCQ